MIHGFSSCLVEINVTKIHMYTLFCKDISHKNIEDEIDPNFKNILRTHPRLRTTGESLL